MAVESFVCDSVVQSHQGFVFKSFKANRFMLDAAAIFKRERLLDDEVAIFIFGYKTINL
jgi:hypothetical protein